MVSHCACPFVLFIPVQCSAKQGGEELLIAAVEPNSPLSKHLLKGVVEAALHCAHRATTVLSWGLCEQEGHLIAPFPSF